MILKASERGGARQLAAHLLNARDNDHVELHELRGFIADDLYGAFKEIQAISLGTKCRKFMFSLSLNPPRDEEVSVETFEQTIEDIESKLGLTGLPRAIIFHEKQGSQGYRRHAHCVWSRIDGARMRAVNISHYKLKLTDMSRSLYREHGWKMPQGLQKFEDADLLNYKHSEHQQAKRAKRDPKELKRIFVQAWERSDSRSAFATALKEHGLILARGDRRGHVAVDAQGEVYAISRWVGFKAKEVRNLFGSPDRLPSVDEALATFAQSASPNAPDIRKPTKNTAAHEAHEQERRAFIQSQRQARQRMKRAHQARKILETKSRSQKLPHGLKAAWFKISGQYQALVKQNELEAQHALQRDRAEWQDLINTQLQGNRDFRQKIIDLRQQVPSDEFYQVDDQRSRLAVDSEQTLVIPPDPEASAVKARVTRNPTHILDVMTETKEKFTRQEIVRKLADYIDDPLKLRSAIENVMRSNSLAQIQSGAEFNKSRTRRYSPNKRGPVLYSTHEFQSVKSAMTTNLSALSKANGTLINKRHIDAAIKSQNKSLKSDVGANLSVEQENAIHYCLGPKRFVPVIGFAGAGKSTMLTAARNAWEGQGLNVIGAALSGKATDGLETASGIKSRTLASILKSWQRGYNPLTANDVLVIDEAGMIGTCQLARFVEAVHTSGAKLVLVGDPEQLQPINAGTPFKEICDTFEPARLTEIHRQKKDWQKKASLDLARLDTAKALKAYEVRGHVKQTKDTDTAIIALVEDYVADLELNGRDKSRLALAHRRKDVHALNQAIRSGIKSGGELADELFFTTDHGKRAFAKGDRILFTKNDSSLSLRNGMIGTVVSITKDEIKIALDGDSEMSGNRKLVINPKFYSSIDHGYAITIHKSQGATVDHCFVLGSATMDKNLTYVAMTRHKFSFKYYCNVKNFLRNELQKRARIISQTRTHGQ